MTRGARFAAAVTAAAAAIAAPTASAQLPAGPVSAKDVEFVRNIAKHTDSPGARLVGKYFYLTTERDLTIYDVSTPENPTEVGSLLLGEDSGTYYFPQEDVDTNGEILITSNAGAIEVIDVRDKTAPKVIGRLAGTAQHTVSCLLNCTWAYGSEGIIVDLRDPAQPKLAGNWRNGPPARATSARHDVTEVAPGIVLTSSQPMYLLDARTNPAAPTTLGGIAHADRRFVHANLWPHQMQDDIVLVGGEETGPGCAESESATFMTYRAANWQTSGFQLLDEYRVLTGTPDEGRMPDSTFCVHWFTPHPTYRNGGAVAIGWYEQGTRILKISRAGEISEIGWFIPLGGTTSSAYWITDRIIYVADYNRGLDILRFTGEIPEPGTPPGADLRLSASDSPDPVTVGDQLTYTLEVTNDGPDAAEAVTLTDELPAGVKLASAPGCTSAGAVVSCPAGALGARASEVFEISVVAQEPGSLANQASVGSSTDDPNSGNNTAESGTQAVCTITGTARNDTLQGTPGRDVICGLGGADTLRGLGGNDLVIGGDGTDKLQGNDGNDQLIGGAGDDELKGGAGDDALVGNAGIDSLNGGSGTDSCSREPDDSPARECETA